MAEQLGIVSANVGALSNAIRPIFKVLFTIVQYVYDIQFLGFVDIIKFFF